MRSVDGRAYELISCFVVNKKVLHKGWYLSVVIVVCPRRELGSHISHCSIFLKIYMKIYFKVRKVTEIFFKKKSNFPEICPEIFLKTCMKLVDFKVRKVTEFVFSKKIRFFRNPKKSTFFGSF